ncbi:MAG TPA: sigma-70 family RNA polymerase sigma factor [bacterium]|nr:sigma-70 family RNA polymerase sigma factor [bacterium]
MNRSAEMSDQPTLLESAKRGDREAFERLAEPYRRELQLHCYRMLGAFYDAEDLVQETFLRAWRGVGAFQFRGAGSFRGWLYRIATNACLKALARRSNAQRVLPERLGPPSDRMPEGEPATEIPWLEPYPDATLEGVPDTAPGPDARYEMREAVQLAFIAAIQHLPPRQRAVLLLRDVLGWSAAETSRLLDASIASVNSALQRAHATLEKRVPAGQPAAQALPDDRQRALLERYVRTWENADLDGFVALLREDAVFRMPPRREWYRGRGAIRVFFGWAWQWYGGFRLIPTAANGQPAFALYSRSPTSLEWGPHSIHVLTLQDDAIAALTMFQAPKVFAAFGLPGVPPDEADITPAVPQK